MIIGVDGSEAFVKDKTGVENYAYQLLKHLAQIDQTNNYIIYLDPRTNQKDSGWPDNFHFKVLSWPIMWTQLGLAIQTYKDRMDLLFIPGHTLPLFKNHFLKSVITVHDLGAEYLGELHQLKQRLYLGLMTKIQLKMATKIIAVSKATKKDLVDKAGISEKNISVIYEGPMDYKNDANTSITKQFDIQKGNYFFFLGTIQPRKNLVRIIDAYEKTFSESGPDLVLAGGKGWLSEPIYQKAKSSPLQSKIKFLGRVSDQVVPDLYKNALALVYPSLFEGFGIPILDAFRYDLPVITSNVSSMPEVAGDAAILVSPNSTEEIGQAMEQLANNKQLRQRLIMKGRAQLKNFSWQKAAKETLELFNSI